MSVAVKMLLGDLCKVVPRGAQLLHAGLLCLFQPGPLDPEGPQGMASQETVTPSQAPLDAEDLFLSHLF